MVQIEQAKNGYIVRINDELIVFQSEHQSMNTALCAVLKYLETVYNDERDIWKVKIDLNT